MLTDLTLSVAPSGEPISVDESKQFMRVDHDDEDTVIDHLIRAARQKVEEIGRLSIITQTWKASFDRIPVDWVLRLPRGPLLSVTSVEYKDSAGTLQTVSSSDYEAGTCLDTGIVRFINTPAYSSEYLNPIQVTYTAGYGADASYVPSRIKQAVHMLTKHWYENRDELLITPGAQARQIPFGIAALIADERNYAL